VKKNNKILDKEISELKATRVVVDLGHGFAFLADKETAVIIRKIKEELSKTLAQDEKLLCRTVFNIYVILRGCQDYGVFEP
jgi:hypothetical protein